VDLVHTTCLVADRPYQLGAGVPPSAPYRFDLPFDGELLAVTNMIPIISAVARAFDPAGLYLDDVPQDD
jgi:hypothetical protein